MPDPRNFRLRATFCKQGRLALLSHLEVARALERTVRRAGLPFAISQGFSPHMKIAFGAALPVGVGGLREVFDLQLTRYVPPEAALEALQAASPPDLMVKDCRYIEAGEPAASVAYPLSTYRALLSCAPAALPVPDEVTVVRKKKEKVLRVSDFLVGEMQVAGAVATFTLEAKPTGSLRPDVLLRACVDAYNNAGGGDAPEGAVRARRVGNALKVWEYELDADGAAHGYAPCAPGELLRIVSVTRIDQRA
ncbi:TIGR03936 family radical SAM-associated protein [Gordonibacter massiliensis (ex Traore et al. 2017)]|uniref:DUF2344 domain-containing protein n=1 Tax=Gordonibacter massiliensis (ex Traore et al. 2017) TaxID=1841863 RepID=A0A842JHZ5_9ACTN|nr:DUF2344 domain-containing protein [Gordonibacter massiliensis (ex Traore et al. 2017)]